MAHLDWHCPVRALRHLGVPCSSDHRVQKRTLRHLCRDRHLRHPQIDVREMSRFNSIPDAIRYYQRQSPIRCALIRHVDTGIICTFIDRKPYVKCMRCGGLFPVWNVPPSIYQWYILRFIAPIRRWWSIRRYLRWCKKHKRWFA